MIKGPFIGHSYGPCLHLNFISAVLLLAASFTLHRLRPSHTHSTHLYHPIHLHSFPLDPFIQLLHFLPCHRTHRLHHVLFARHVSLLCSSSHRQKLSSMGWWHEGLASAQWPLEACFWLWEEASKDVVLTAAVPPDEEKLERWEVKAERACGTLKTAISHSSGCSLGTVRTTLSWSGTPSRPPLCNRGLPLASMPTTHSFPPSWML